MGSTSYLTNKQGNVSQHVEYIPFGETLIENHLNNQNNPYLYNGKELDAEIGFYYYGARYYDPKSSLWLSVDPLAEKMPDFSAYAYAFNNPIYFIDKDGMTPSGPGDKWGTITISTNVTERAGLLTGHAWITITNNNGAQMTMSLYANLGEQEFWVNMEINDSSSVSRTVDITESQADIISEFNSIEANVDWNSVNTCAGYSASLWEEVTGEALNTSDIFGFGEPSVLAESIFDANGNNYSNTPVEQKTTLTSQESTKNSSANSSNSNSSSGSSTSGSSTSSSSSGSSSGSSSIGGPSGLNNELNKNPSQEIRKFIFQGKAKPEKQREY